MVFSIHKVIPLQMIEVRAFMRVQSPRSLHVLVDPRAAIASVGSDAL